MAAVRWWSRLGAALDWKAACARVVGVLLLAAAAGKLYGVLREPLAAWAFPLGRMAYAFVTAWEALLGMWLLVGFRVRLALVASLATHLGFLGYHIWAAGKLPRSCGCFGILEVPEGFARAMAAAGALVTVIGCVIPLNRGAACTKFRPFGFAATLVMAVVFLAGVLLASDRVKVRREGVLLSERVAWLEPDRWSGKRFPLLRFMEGAIPKGDTYRVVLVRRGCERCRAFLERLEQRDHQDDLVLIFVDGLPAGERLPANVAQLQQRWRWSVDTPLVVVVRGGIVDQVGGGDLLFRVNSNQARASSTGGDGEAGPRSGPLGRHARG